MSSFKARVTKIESEDTLHIVTFSIGNKTLKMMSLDLNASLKVESEVRLSVKATAVALGKDLGGMLSYSNQLALKIKTLKEGKLLSSVLLEDKDFTLESIITSASVRRMNLKIGEEVIALIKSSDLSICEYL